MKTAFAFALLVHMATTAHAMDFSGFDVREIPIPQDKAEQAKRAEVLQPYGISKDEFSKLTDDQKVKVILLLQAIAEAQAKFVADEAAQDRVQDARLNPEALCAKAFGADYHYGGSVARENADNTFNRSYLCTKDGPSERTPFEQRMAALNGVLTHVRYKLRHPLTTWAG